MAGRKTNAVAVVDKDPLVQYRTQGVPKDYDFDQIGQELAEAGAIMSSVELGSGWTVLPTDQKSRLIGVPIIVLDWTFNDGDNGEFVSARVLTKQNERLVLNDGSTGICQQLRDLEMREETRAVFCKRGLRVSEYEYEAPDGSKRPAKTYYLDTSA